MVAYVEDALKPSFGDRVKRALTFGMVQPKPLSHREVGLLNDALSSVPLSEEASKKITATLWKNRDYLEQTDFHGKDAFVQLQETKRENVNKTMSDQAAMNKAFSSPAVGGDVQVAAPGKFAANLGQGQESGACR